MTGPHDTTEPHEPHDPADPSKPVFHWHRLLAPDSPLINQPVKVATAVCTLDGEAFRREISMKVLLPPDDFHAYWAVSMYIEHIYALNTLDWDKAQSALKEVRDTLGPGRANHARRLGNVVIGVAKGSLIPQLYAEAEDLLRYVLTDDEADAIMARIKRRQSSTKLRHRLALWIKAKWEEVQGIASGAGPGKDRLPTMEEECGPRPKQDLKE